MRRSLWKLIIPMAALLAATPPAMAEPFTLTSKDIVHGEFMGTAQEFEGFGCSGGNTSPELSWTGAPEGTETFAVFVYDPDAPTGSGWWHWQVINIPKDITTLAAGAGNVDESLVPEGSINIRNDYGAHGFGGACPPKGHGVHRYRFTVYALPMALDLPADASSALTGYMVHANALASSTIEALYQRD